MPRIEILPVSDAEEWPQAFTPTIVDAGHRAVIFSSADHPFGSPGSKKTSDEPNSPTDPAAGGHSTSGPESPNSTRTKLFVIDVRIPALGDETFTALINSSATSNLISSDILRSNVTTTTWEAEQRTIYGGGVSIMVHGNVTPRISLTDSIGDVRHAEHEFRMIKRFGMAYDVVLGMSWIHCANVDAEFHEQKWYWRQHTDSPYRKTRCECPKDFCCGRFGSIGGGVRIED